MTERSIPHIREIFGEDSAVGTSCDDNSTHEMETRSKKKTKGRRTDQDNFKNLERHLSMKKTIRKKMMRDLQQAFVSDPEVAKEGDMSSLTYQGKKKKEEGFLDFLKSGGKKNEDIDSGRGSPSSKEERDEDKKGFWRRFTIRRAKR